MGSLVHNACVWAGRVHLKGIIEANSKEAKTDRNITIHGLERNDIPEKELVEQKTAELKPKTE